MNPQPDSSSSTGDELDLQLLFFKLRKRWPYFVASLALAGILAFVYLQMKAPVYEFRSTMLLGDQATGSKQAQELLQILEVQEKGMKMEDEIGLITSGGTVHQAVRRLPYAAAYYMVPNSWINKIRTLQVREQPAGGVPFRVEPNLKVPQLTGVPIYVEPAGPGRFRVRAEAKKGRLTDLDSGELIREAWDVAIDVTVQAGDTLRHPLLQLVIKSELGQEFGGGKYYFTLNDVGTAAGRLAGDLTVKPIEHDSRIVELRTKNTVPANAIMFLDTLMAVYVAADLQAKNITGRKTVAFLDEEIAKLDRSRRQTAGALSSFRSTRGVVDVSSQSNSGILRMSELQAARAKVATSRKYYQEMLAYLRANRRVGQVASPSSAGIDDPVLNGLIMQLGDLNSKRAAMGVNASDSNPLVTVLDERINTTKESLIQTLTNMGRTADIGLRDLDAQLGQVRGQMSRMPEDERQLSSLKNESDFNEKNYNFLVEKRNEAGLALATNTTDKRVVDHAQGASAGPESPNPKLVGILALLAGVFIPAGLILLIDKANRTIQSKEDLSRVTDIPLLGVVAHGSRTDKKSMLLDARGPIAESFRSIRVNLQYLAAGPDKKVLGVTSSIPGEGKTFCAVNLASELAMSGRRVVLIETDLRRPTVANYFEIEKHPRHGLATYLSGQSTLDDCCLPSGRARPRSDCLRPHP
jgi:uncharacterized protein involved in exopolysaccharide biosynthesis